MGGSVFANEPAEQNTSRSTIGVVDGCVIKWLAPPQGDFYTGQRDVRTLG
jgi:hypothetical protein